MANEEHLAILKQGVEVWNNWRKENPELKLNLSGVDLKGMLLAGVNLNDVNLWGVNLRKANLTRAYLRRANLQHANLTQANLLGATLTMVDLSSANLSLADFSWADLPGANIRGAQLKGTKFYNSAIGGSEFIDMDLSQVEGLDSVIHVWPSTIGVDTLFKSKGTIPAAFLRGAGVPEEFIEYLPHLITGKAIQYYSCFISYSTKNQDFAERLHVDLQSRGVRCWFAPEDIKGGRKMYEQIPEAIRLYDKLLLVLSEQSMQSEWVKTEIYHARQDEVRNNKRKLFPIGLVEFSKIREWTAFDADVGKDMAREIREYYIPDFSNWKDHDAYKQAFDRLLRDLNLDAEE